MADYNADFWEIPIGSEYLENLPSNRALWYETQEDRSRRYAFQEFFEEVSPVVRGLMGANLTKRQEEVVQLYYLHGKTQEGIATILDLTQSTVSGHLFGTMPRGKTVGLPSPGTCTAPGAVPSDTMSGPDRCSIAGPSSL